MLLTRHQQALTEPKFDVKYPNEYSPPLFNPPKFSPKVTGSTLRPLSASNHRASPGPHVMSNPHRGLPPPAAMTLPDPGRGPPPPMPPQPQSMGSMPAPPPHWQGAEESMKSWLMAKAEEEKRKQEEEKTKQEQLKLEQRNVERGMLHDSLNGNVPPQLVPLIFAGIGGGNLAHLSLEFLQQYMGGVQSTVQQHQQPAQPQLSQAQHSPDLRREQQQPRLLNPAPPQPSGYGVAAPGSQQNLPAASVLQGQTMSAVQQHGAYSTPSYALGSQSPQTRTRASTISGGQAGPIHSAPRPSAQSNLPRLTTNEMQIQQPPTAGSNVHMHQQPQQEQQSSPSIYFHHWVPPTSQHASSSRDPPATPSDYTTSPRKRKAQGAHQPAPPPTSAPQYTSPPFSQDSSSASTPARRGHARTRSDTSTRAHETGRPTSRHGMRPTTYSYPESDRRGSRGERAEERPRQHDRRESGGGREGLRASRTSTPSRSHHQPPPTSSSPKREEGY